MGLLKIKVAAWYFKKADIITSSQNDSTAAGTRGPIDQEDPQLVGGSPLPSSHLPCLDFDGVELAYQNNAKEKKFRICFDAEVMYRSLSVTLTIEIFLEGVSLCEKP